MSVNVSNRAIHNAHGDLVNRGEPTTAQTYYFPRLRAHPEQELSMILTWLSKLEGVRADDPGASLETRALQAQAKLEPRHPAYRAIAGVIERMDRQSVFADRAHV